MSQNPSDSSGKCSLIDSSQSQLPIKCYDAAFHQGPCADLLVARSPSSKLQQNCEKQEKNLKKGFDKKKQQKKQNTAHVYTDYSVWKLTHTFICFIVTVFVNQKSGRHGVFPSLQLSSILQT